MAGQAPSFTFGNLWGPGADAGNRLALPGLRAGVVSVHRKLLLRLQPLLLATKGPTTGLPQHTWPRQADLHPVSTDTPGVPRVPHVRVCPNDRQTAQWAATHTALSKLLTGRSALAAGCSAYGMQATLSQQGHAHRGAGGCAGPAEQPVRRRNSSCSRWGTVWCQRH